MRNPSTNAVCTTSRRSRNRYRDLRCVALQRTAQRPFSRPPLRELGGEKGTIRGRKPIVRRFPFDPPSSTGRSPTRKKRKQLVWEIERRLAEDGARPVIFYPRQATCRHPQVKGMTMMVNSIYNGFRFEDLWLDNRARR